MKSGAAARDAWSTAKPEGGLRILLLEDSRADAELIAARLEDAGLQFELERVESHAGFNGALTRAAFDIILSDYNVPGFDGTAALAAARLACPEVPFLFVSGALGDETAIDLLKRGATDYVLKDRLERLAPSVQRALREAQDKAQQRRAEEEIKQRAEFEQQLIGIVSHDLRNPLNAITLGAEMLLLRDELTPKSGEAVRRILANAQRAARMIRDLLDFTQARLGGGIPVERKALDLHVHASQVLGELQHLHSDRKLELRREGDTHGEWDPDRIAQVIVNLVGNALKYSPSDTGVTVTVKGGADEVRLEVHNYGEAIAPELLPHLFTPLSRGGGKVDMQTRSIGLGLFIVDSIVKGHGGRVTARSTADAGTTFSVELPRLARQL